MKSKCQNLNWILWLTFSVFSFFTCTNVCASIQEPASSTLAPGASASGLSAPYLTKSNISSILTPHSSSSMRQSILTPASGLSENEDIEKLSAMKAYYSQKLDSAIVSTDIHSYVSLILLLILWLLYKSLISFSGLFLCFYLVGIQTG